jgi:cell division protein FtsW
MERVQTYLDPTRDPQGSGYQIQQSLIAVGSGGMWGRGYGQSIQKFSYLPEASSDAVFAVFAEEFGFWGSILLVFLYLCFVLRGLWISARAHDLFGGLVALGLVICIGSQVFLNIAAMIGLVPVGGLPLPFTSHGGSALFMTLTMAGIILAVSKTVRG